MQKPQHRSLAMHFSLKLKGKVQIKQLHVGNSTKYEVCIHEWVLERNFKRPVHQPGLESDTTLESLKT